MGHEVKWAVKHHKLGAPGKTHRVCRSVIKGAHTNHIKAGTKSHCHLAVPQIENSRAAALQAHAQAIQCWYRMAAD